MAGTSLASIGATGGLIGRSTAPVCRPRRRSDTPAAWAASAGGDGEVVELHVDRAAGRDAHLAGGVARVDHRADPPAVDRGADGGTGEAQRQRVPGVGTERDR